MGFFSELFGAIMNQSNDNPHQNYQKREPTAEDYIRSGEIEEDNYEENPEEELKKRKEEREMERQRMKEWRKRLDLKKKKKEEKYAEKMKLISIELNKRKLEIKKDRITKIGIGKNKSITLALRYTDNIKRYGFVEIDDNFTITSFVEKGNLPENKTF